MVCPEVFGIGGGAGRTEMARTVSFCPPKVPGGAKGVFFAKFCRFWRSEIVSG
jgi:hypothetical protein